MKKIVQYSQPDLIRLLSQDLVAKGTKVELHDFSVEFVTNADGETSALISGVEDENVQEPETDEGEPDERSRLLRVGSRDALRQEVYDIVAVTLTKKGHTVDELVELVCKELSEEHDVDTATLGSNIRVALIKSLQHLEKQGRAEYVDDGELELWRKKSKKQKPIPKVTTLSTAADILGGKGGVMDRSDALSEGASEGQPRQGTPRRKKAPRRRSGSRNGGDGGGRGGPGPGSGKPFTF
jgi:hypothetical protein